MQDKGKAAREVAEQMYREHPEYVYARANLAESLSKLPAEIGRIPEILHPSLNLTALFPNRKAFHFGECIVYERYRDSAALQEHLQNLGDLMGKVMAICTTTGEVLGEPSPELANGLAEFGVPVYRPWLKL